eukprot:gene13291-9129_t
MRLNPSAKEYTPSWQPQAPDSSVRKPSQPAIAYSPSPRPLWEHRPQQYIPTQQRQYTEYDRAPAYGYNPGRTAFNPYSGWDRGYPVAPPPHVGPRQYALPAEKPRVDAAEFYPSMALREKKQESLPNSGSPQGAKEISAPCPIVLLFLGCRGAGKTTQALLAAEKYNLLHVSSGDLCKQGKEPFGELKKIVKEHFGEGVSRKYSGLALDRFVVRSEIDTYYVQDALAVAQLPVPLAVWLRLDADEGLQRAESRGDKKEGSAFWRREEQRILPMVAETTFSPINSLLSIECSDKDPNSIFQIIVDRITTTNAGRLNDISLPTKKPGFAGSLVTDYDFAPLSTMASYFSHCFNVDKHVGALNFEVDEPIQDQYKAARAKDSPIDFILDTEMCVRDGKGTFFVIDFVYFYSAVGARMRFAERYKLLQQGMINMRNNGAPIVLKQYMPINQLEILLPSLEDAPFPIDGVVIQHGDVYSYGADKLLSKWKPRELCTADFRLSNGRQLPSGDWEFELDVLAFSDGTFKEERFPGAVGHVTGEEVKHHRLMNNMVVEMALTQQKENESVWKFHRSRADKPGPNKMDIVSKIVSMQHLEYSELLSLLLLSSLYYNALMTLFFLLFLFEEKRKIDNYHLNKYYFKTHFSFFFFFFFSIMSGQNNMQPKKLNPEAPAFVPPGGIGTADAGFAIRGPTQPFQNRPTTQPRTFKQNPMGGPFKPHGFSASSQDFYPQRVPFLPSEPEMPASKKVILVAGYSKMGKTTVAKKIAEQFNYVYVNVKKTENPASISLVQRFSSLTDALRDLNGKNGVVIDDAVHVSRFDPYYVNHILEAHKLHINAAVLLTAEPKDVGRVSMNDIDKQAHPDSFEFGFALEDENGSDRIINLSVDQPLQSLIDDVLHQLKMLDSQPLVSLKLPVMNFIPNASMVTDPEFVETVIQAEAKALGTETCEYFYCFPFVLPNFILDYTLFAKSALLMKHYRLIPWIWGAKISIIGYNNSVYVHVPSYQLLFLLDEASPDLKKLCIEMSKSLPPPKDGEPKVESPLTFSLDAVMKDDKIYISDMMYLAGEFGSKKLLHDRVALMKKHLGNLKSPISLLHHYPVCDIEKCWKENSSVACGVIFINPDGMLPGTYDSRNIVFYMADVKRVPLRLWNGTEDEKNWTFEAYALDNNVEKPVEKCKVVISKDEVDQHALNDGHIVDCVPGWVENHPAKKQRTYKFASRCNWEVKPVTLYYYDAIMKAKDNPEIFVKACANIKCEEFFS